jgi:HAD superfamily hydrolase (TIGR01509 family)
MFKAVIFDFDGVIIDTEHKRFSDLKTVLAKHGLGLEDSAFSDLPGKKTAEFVHNHFPAIGREMAEKIAEERRDLQHNELDGHRLIEGIPGLLELLRSKEYRLAVVTGSQRFIVDELLDMHNLSEFFEIVITGEDFKSSKPDPECYRMALNRLGLKPDEAVIIEDAPHGITAAKRAGCKVFGVKTSFKGEELKEAEMVFNDAGEIRKHFESSK